MSITHGFGPKIPKISVDSTPTQDSQNPVSSGGVYDALQNIDMSKITPTESTMNLYGYSHDNPPPSGKTYQEYSTDAILSQIHDSLASMSSNEDMFNAPIQEDIKEVTESVYATTSQNIASGSTVDEFTVDASTTSYRYAYVISGAGYTFNSATGKFTLTDPYVDTFSYKNAGSSGSPDVVYGALYNSKRFYIKGYYGIGYSNNTNAANAGASRISSPVIGDSIYYAGSSSKISVAGNYLGDDRYGTTANIKVSGSGSGYMYAVSNSVQSISFIKQKLSNTPYTASELVGTGYTISNIGTVLPKIFITSMFDSTSFICPFRPILIMVKGKSSATDNNNSASYIILESVYSVPLISASTSYTATFSYTPSTKTVNITSSLLHAASGYVCYCLGI